MRNLVFALLFVVAAVTGVGPTAANAGPQPAVVCGDGIAQAPEECDDGNTTGGDGCDQLCRLS